jgi:hypothetical protein
MGRGAEHSSLAGVSFNVAKVYLDGTRAVWVLDLFRRSGWF